MAALRPVVVEDRQLNRRIVQPRQLQLGIKLGAVARVA